LQLVWDKVKEVVFSVLPIFVVVIILGLFVIPLNSDILVKFILGTVFMIIGMPVFLLGIDIAITPIGELSSEALTKTNKLWIILAGGGAFGFIVTAAEPDLHILSGQVNAITNGRFNTFLMIMLVSLGVGVLVSYAMYRILRNHRLNRVMTVIYLIIFILALFNNPDFLAIAFDASGTTTGNVSVPFLLALAAGISALTRSNEAEENDSFGMLGIASAGAIIAVLVQGVLTGGPPLEGSLPSTVITSAGPFVEIITSIPQYARETLIVLMPIVIIFFAINFITIKLPRKKLRRIIVGCVYTYVGLVIFLTGVNVGLIEASSQVGYQLASLGRPWLIVLVGMVFGVITIPAEPSVHVLTGQIEDETAGSIRSSVVMLTLCVGVAIAVGLSILRIIIPSLQLWHILLPGMLIAIILSYYVPDIFVGIAFDSGGVAAGTMTAAFILPFAQGVAEYLPGANIVQDAFGVIALVAMTPLITCQLLGLIYKMMTRPVLAEEDMVEEGILEENIIKGES